MATVNATNLITNGGFETNTSGWTWQNAAWSRVALPGALPTGNPGSYCAQAPTANMNFSGATMSAEVSSAIPVTSGRKYYIRAYVRTNNTNVNAVQFMNGGSALTGISSVSISSNVWTTLEYIWTSNLSSITPRINFTGSNGNNGKLLFIDNIMILDLTAIYGVSKEPDLTILRTDIAANGMFWEGVKSITIPDELAITTTTIQPYYITRNKPYSSIAIQATGGTPPYSWITAIGNYGLDINSITGVISGITTNSDGVISFSVTVRDSVNRTTSKQFSLSVGTEPSISTASPLTEGVLGKSYSQSLSATGTLPITWSVYSGTLPNGLSLTGSVISGTAQTIQQSTFTIRAVNNWGVHDKQFTLNVRDLDIFAWLRGERIGRCWMNGEEIREIFLKGERIYRKK